MRANRACSIACSVTIAPSSVTFPEPRATRSRKSLTCAACRCDCSTPPVCAKPTDELERAGLERTEKSLGAADLILHIADANAPKPSDFAQRQFERARIVILNKSDLPEHNDWQGYDALRISCLTEDRAWRNWRRQILERIGARSRARGKCGRDQRAASRLSAPRAGRLRTSG